MKEEMMVTADVDKALEERHALERAKFDAAIGNRALSELGLAVGIRMSLGHTSRRVPGDPNRFVVKGRGYRIDSIREMRPEDMVVCDLDGNWLDGPPYSLQCGEVKIHSCIYQARPDVVSVTHVHPDYVVLMSVLGVPIKPMAQEGARLVLNPIPVFPQTKTVNSDAEGKEVARLLGDGDAVILFGHGAVTVSTRSVEGSVMAMAQLEHQARLNYLAIAAMGADHPSIPETLARAIGSGGVEPHHKKRLDQVPGGRAPEARWEYFREMLGTL
jgi:ribulose-5-phosphate 4-epimerase/fuculose-1-phosphate aldolase